MLTAACFLVVGLGLRLNLMPGVWLVSSNAHVLKLLSVVIVVFRVDTGTSHRRLPKGEVG